MTIANERQDVFIKPFMFSMLAFLLLIAVQSFAFELYEMPYGLQIIVALMPIIPLFWSFSIYRKQFIIMDEYMQRLTGEAFLWMLAIVGFATFAYGMLIMKMSFPAFNICFILPIIFGGHGLVVQLLLWKDKYEE